MRIWDTETGQQILSLNGHEGERRLEFTAAGDRLIVYQQDRTELWHVSAGSAHLSLSTPGWKRCPRDQQRRRAAGRGRRRCGKISVWTIPSGTGSQAANLADWGAGLPRRQYQLLGHGGSGERGGLQPGRAASGDRQPGR